MAPYRVLYIDDDPDIREVAQMSLELDPQFDVRAGVSGRDGLAIAAEWKPHLILLDVMMPEMDGPETLRRLKATPALNDVPVVFITARAQTHEVSGLLELGAHGFIAKPFDPLTLAQLARGYLE
ncbi:response regulator [Amorphus coralli]|uniref:response regulator n=1 Tax=Amorphus coralli TaxID=340680 RepID=UPI0003625CDB|nr:response regulator [Amorphus coralli]